MDAEGTPTFKSEEDEAAKLFGMDDDQEDKNIESELFGDFQSEEESAEAKPPPKRSADADIAGPRKKKRKMAAGEDVSKYFDIEAEEGGGSGDEDEDDDLEGLIDDSGVAPGDKGRDSLRKLANQKELNELAQDMDSRGPEAGAQRVFGSSFLDKMEDKYKKLEEAGVTEQAMHEPVSPNLMAGKKKETNTYIVPNAKDPKMFCCKTFGPERDLILSLLNKSRQCFLEGKPVPIHSAFFAPHLRGYIYIEAFKEAEIRKFIRGIYGISPWAINLVPVLQMTSVFTSAITDGSKQKDIKAGDWVRVKRGAYKDDLALVDEIKDDQYIVKLKPRLDIGRKQAKDRDERIHRRRSVARWFNRQDVEAGGLVVNTEKRMTPTGYLTFYIVGEEAYRDGYVFKNMKVGFFEIDPERVKPQEHEIQDWRTVPPPSESNRPQMDLALEEDTKKLMPPPSFIPKKSVAHQKLPLEEGDIVICCQGDLKNLRGEVVKAISGQPTVMVRPIEHRDALKGDISFARDMLSKYFGVGDYVKVLGGEHMGDTGHVIKVIAGPPGNEWGMSATAMVATVTADVCTREFKVFIDQLRRTVERACAQEQVGEFFAMQLVKVNRGEATGVLLRLEANQRAKVLLTTGERKMVTFGEMEPAMGDRRKYEKSVWTPDRKGMKIIGGDTVKAPSGMQKSAPVQAEVLYIYQSYVFLRILEHKVGEAAIVVCNGVMCERCYDKPNLVRVEKQVEMTSEAAKGVLQYGITMASQHSFLRQSAARMLGLTNGETKQEIQPGEGVRIVGGSYKGLRGEMRADLGELVRISLLCKPKIVEVHKNMVRVDELSNLKRKRMGEMPGGTNIAPATPPATFDMPAPASPVSELENQSAQENDDDDADAWDPDFGERPPATPPRNADVAAPATPDVILTAPAPATPEVILTAPDDTRLAATPASPAAAGPASTTPMSVPASKTPIDLAASKTPTGMPASKTPTGEAAPQTPQTPTGEAAPQTPTSVTSAKRRRTQARLPGKTDEVNTSPSMFPSFEASPAVLTEADDVELWMKVGIGVTFTIRSKRCVGWIVKVFGDSAQVVLSDARVGDDRYRMSVRSKDMRPLPPDKRGNALSIFDGAKTHRGKIGKVTALTGDGTVVVSTKDGNKVGIRTLRVRSTECAQYSEAWVAAIQQGNLDSQAGRGPGSVVSGQHNSVKSQKDSSRNASAQPSAQPTPVVSDAEENKSATGGDLGNEQELDDMLRTRPWAVDGQDGTEATGAVTVESTGGDETPVVVSATSAPPIAIADSTPVFAPELETPPQKFEGAATPVPGATTPLLPAGPHTPAMKQLLGATTPITPGFLPGKEESITPSIPGIKTPTLPPGSVTPPLPGGSVTPPLPGKFEVKGKMETPPIKGEETPVPGLTAAKTKDPDI